MIHVPKITYLVSSPFGDLAVDEDKWHLPLDGDPCKTSYRAYFSSIRDFILHHRFRPITEPSEKKLNRSLTPEDLIELVIRSEKHGALYHPASIEVFFEDARVKLCLNVAVTDEGRKWLRHEASVLDLLHLKFDLPYLPRPHYSKEFNSMFFLVADWFDGYHEFHLSIDEQGRQRLKLWDFDRGDRYLTQKQSFRLYFLISRLLTMYYDLESASQIYPWHHAAGDFIARISHAPEKHLEQETDVRLTTARGYGPQITLDNNGPYRTLIGLYHFFLCMTIRMRLDKLDGVGKVAWADDLCLVAAIKGFFEALRFKINPGLSNSSTEDFLSVLKTFNPGEIRSSCDQILEGYAQKEEYLILKNNIDRHVQKLHATLQSFSICP